MVSHFTIKFLHQTFDFFQSVGSPVGRHRVCRFLPSLLSEYLFVQFPCTMHFYSLWNGLSRNIVLPSSKVNLVQLGHIVCLSPCSFAFWVSWLAITLSFVYLNIMVSAFISPKYIGLDLLSLFYYTSHPECPAPIHILYFDYCCSSCTCLAYIREAFVWA